MVEDINIEFITVSTSDKLMTMSFNGQNIEIVADKVRSFKTENKLGIVDGLNHMIYWAKENDKRDFLVRLGLFIVTLKHKITSVEFNNEVNRRLRESRGRDEMDKVKRDIYSEIFANIDSQLILGIMEYTESNLEYNSDNEKNKNITIDELNLAYIETFIFSIIIVLAKLIMIGGILVNVKKNSTLVQKVVVEMINVLTTGGYLYQYFHKTGQYDKAQHCVDFDIHSNIYRYFKEYIDVHISKDKVVAEVSQRNGVARDDLVANIIASALSAIYKVRPIHVLSKDTHKYTSDKDWHEYKYTSSCIIAYINMVLKSSHSNNSTKYIHPNVIKTKRIQDDVNNNAINLHKQEVILEKRDSKDLERRRDNIESLSKYVNEYIKKNKIPMEGEVLRSDFSNFFIIKVLAEVGEDYISVKLVSDDLYKKIILMVSHKLMGKYFSLSMALKATKLFERTILDTEEINIESKLQRLDNYILEPRRFKEYFLKIIKYDFRYESDNANNYHLEYIENDFLDFLYETQDDGFTFIDGYIYDV